MLKAQSSKFKAEVQRNGQRFNKKMTLTAKSTALLQISKSSYANFIIHSSRLFINYNSLFFFALSFEP
jgi:hypothetical protein